MSHNARYYRKKNSTKTTTQCQKIDTLFKQQQQDAPTGSQSDSNTVVKENELPKQTQVTENELPVTESEEIRPCNVDAQQGELDAESEGDDWEPPKKVKIQDSRKKSTHEFTFPWLYHRVVKEAYFCKYCEFRYGDSKSDTSSPFAAGGVPSLGTHPTRKLEKHQKSESHQQAQSVYMSSDSQKFLGNELNHKPVEDHLVHHPTITYTLPSSVQEIGASLSFSIEGELLDSIREAGWYSLLPDESADDANREQLAIIIRFIDPNSGNIREIFLGLLKLQCTDAESLMSSIEAILIAKALDVTKAVFVGFDGCNVMSGVNTGVQRRFRHLVPHQVYINCRNHRLALCVKHLVKEFPVLQELDSLLLGIWKLFHYSPKRCAVFEEIQETYQQKKLKFIRASTTRWLSHGHACVRLLDRFPSILDTLDAIYQEKKEPEILGLRNMLTDKKTIATATVLCDALKPVVIFSDYLQGNVHFSRELTDELHHLTERYRFCAEGNAADHDVDLHFSKLPTYWAEIDDRTEFARRLRQQGEANVYTMAQVVAELAVPFIHALIHELEDGFHCSPVLAGFKAFEVKDVPNTMAELAEFGEEEIKCLAEHYGNTLEDVFKGHRTVSHPVFSEETFKQQFAGFKHQMFLMKQRASEDELANPQFLLRQFQDDNILRASYPAMYHMILLSCLIPSSTACVERLFSLMNTICTPQRNCLKQQSLDNIIRIVSETSGSLNERQLTRALDHFRASKDKLLNF